MFKVLLAAVLPALTAVGTSASVYYPPEYSAPRPIPKDGPSTTAIETAEYQFKYGVHDASTGQAFQHSEKRQGAETRGSYEVALPDGRIQVVTYTADENGFIADVSYKDEPKPASVAYSKPRHFYPSPWYSLPRSSTVTLAPLFRATFTKNLAQKAETELTETSWPTNATHLAKDVEKSTETATENHFFGARIEPLTATDESSTAAAFSSSTSEVVNATLATPITSDYAAAEERTELASSTAATEVSNIPLTATSSEQVVETSLGANFADSAISTTPGDTTVVERITVASNTAAINVSNIPLAVGSNEQLPESSSATNATIEGSANSTTPGDTSVVEQSRVAHSTEVSIIFLAATSTEQSVEPGLATNATFASSSEYETSTTSTSDVLGDVTKTSVEEATKIVPATDATQSSITAAVTTATEERNGTSALLESYPKVDATPTGIATSATTDNPEQLKLTPTTFGSGDTTTEDEAADEEPAVVIAFANDATPTTSLLLERGINKPKPQKYPYSYKYSPPYYSIPYSASRYPLYRPSFYSHYPWYTPYYRYQLQYPDYPYQHQRGAVTHLNRAYFTPRYY